MWSLQELAVNRIFQSLFKAYSKAQFCPLPCPQPPGSVGFLAAFQVLHALGRAGPRAGRGDHEAGPELFGLLLFSSVPWAWFGGSSELCAWEGAGRWLQEGCSCLWARTCHNLIQAQRVWTMHQSCTYLLRTPHFFQDVRIVQAATCHTQNFPKSILLHLTLKVNNLIVL